MNSIIVELLGLFIEWLRKHNIIRVLSLLFSILSALFIITLLGIAETYKYYKYSPLINQLAPLFLIFIFCLFIPIIFSFTSIKIKGRGIFGIDLDTLYKERRKIQERIAEQIKPDIFDTIQLNLNQLTEYYTINKSQARNSFRCSIFAIIMGLITIIGGIWLFYFRNDPNIGLTSISVISGTLIEFIGVSYFYIYRKSLDQLNFFFEQLVKMQDTMLAIRLCDQINPEEKQLEIRERIISKLLDRSSG